MDIDSLDTRWLESTTRVREIFRLNQYLETDLENVMLFQSKNVDYCLKKEFSKPILFKELTGINDPIQVNLNFFSV